MTSLYSPLYLKIFLHLPLSCYSNLARLNKSIHVLIFSAEFWIQKSHYDISSYIDVSLEEVADTFRFLNNYVNITTLNYHEIYIKILATYNVMTPKTSLTIPNHHLTQYIGYWALQYNRPDILKKIRSGNAEVLLQTIAAEMKRYDCLKALFEVSELNKLALTIAHLDSKIPVGEFLESYNISWSYFPSHDTSLTKVLEDPEIRELIKKKYKTQVIQEVKTGLETYRSGNDPMSILLRYRFNELTEVDLNNSQIKLLYWLKTDIKSAIKLLEDENPIDNNIIFEFQGFIEILNYLFSLANDNTDLFRAIRKSHRGIISFLFLLPNNYQYLEEIIYSDATEMNQLYDLPLFFEALKAIDYSLVKEVIDPLLAKASEILKTDVQNFDSSIVFVKDNRDIHLHNDLFQSVNPLIQEIYKIIGKTIRILKIGSVVHIVNLYLFKKLCSKLTKLELQLILIHPCFKRQSNIHSDIVKHALTKFP